MYTLTLTLILGYEKVHAHRHVAHTHVRTYIPMAKIGAKTPEGIGKVRQMQQNTPCTAANAIRFHLHVRIAYACMGVRVYVCMGVREYVCM